MMRETLLLLMSFIISCFQWIISKFILDYIFYVITKFSSFKKPITPSLDIIFKMTEQWIKDTFYVPEKSDGIRQLLLIINNLILVFLKTLKLNLLTTQIIILI